jgi:hypothetical protein
MTRSEFNEFVDAELRGRWPKWEPTPSVLDDWYRLLRYHSLPVATEAVQEHRVSDKANAFEPQINWVAKWLREHAGQRKRQRSWGPCFVIVRDDGARFPHHIESVDEPTEGQIRATAEAAALRWTSAHLRPFHWERPDAESPMAGPLRGQSALAEAKRIILDEPGDSAGKRFLIERKRLAERMALPAGPERPTYASRTMLDRLQEPQPQPSGPSKDFNLPMDPSEDENWEAG